MPQACNTVGTLLVSTFAWSAELCMGFALFEPVCAVSGTNNNHHVIAHLHACFAQ